MSDDEIICVCITVTRGEIKKAIEEGYKTVDDLKSYLLCCTGCGTCEPKVRALLEQELASKNFTVKQDP